jgi:hypothetical protein
MPKWAHQKWIRERLILDGALEIAVYTVLVVLAVIGLYPFFFTR